MFTEGFDYEFYTACRNFFQAWDPGITVTLGMNIFILVVFSLHGHEEIFSKKMQENQKKPPHNSRVDRETDFNVGVDFTELY